MGLRKEAVMGDGEPGRGGSDPGHGAVSESEAEAMLVKALMMLDAEWAREAILAGVSPEGSDGSGGPLRMACFSKSLKMVQALLESGADPDGGVANQWPHPLHYAAIAGGQTGALMVRALLSAGASLDAVDESGRSPLHWAAEFAEREALEDLINAGASALARDHRGKKPSDLCEREDIYARLKDRERAQEQREALAGVAAGQPGLSRGRGV